MTLDDLIGKADAVRDAQVKAMLESIIDESPFVRELGEQMHRQSVARWAEWLHGWQDFHDGSAA